MSREKQIEERNQLADLLADIGRDWDNYLDECQENEIEPCFTYEDFHADSLLDAGYRKASDVAAEIFAELALKAPFFCENQIAYEHFNEELAELKKKYTESEGAE